METFPDMLKKARENAGLTFRQLEAELVRRETPASITQLNFVERRKMKPTYSLAFDTATVTGMGIEEALRSAFMYRVEWCIEREREALEALARKKGLNEEAIQEIISMGG